MHLKKVIENLKLSKNLPELNQTLKTFLKDLGITYYSFTYYTYHPNSQGKIKYDHSSTSFQRWHKHYLEENYEDIDSLLLELYNNVLPIFWDLQKQLADAKTERERQMRLDSIEFGTKKGLSIPIHGPNDDFANFLVVQMKGQTCLENWEDLQFDLQTYAYNYYHYLQRHLLANQPGVTNYNLSEREMQCLLLVAKRYNVSQIAKTLKITERTVNFHIQKINKKLKTANKYQSVAKALEKKLINL